jgi:glutaredoxin
VSHGFIPNWYNALSAFQKALALCLLAAFIVLLMAPSDTEMRHSDDSATALPSHIVHIFYHPECPHCHDAIAFLEKQEGLPKTRKLDVTSTHGQHLVTEAISEFGLQSTQLGVPLIVYDRKWRIGFDTAETTGKELLAWLKEGSANHPDHAPSESIDLPLFGEISLHDTSLPVLTIMLGIADGFNPCAMWVLVYLISIVAGLQDRRKIWWLVGTFVTATGVLYYLFMTAWLNTFLLVGDTRPLTLLIGLSAIGFGINHLYELIRNRGQVACHVGDIESRQRTIGKIRAVINAPIGLSSIMGMLGLAFAVNAIEFVCSAALPAIYTHTLSLMELSTVSYYLYILLYVIFFMLDDLVIFALAAFAVQKVIDSRYAAYSRAIGGILLVGLGGWMLFH